MKHGKTLTLAVAAILLGLGCSKESNPQAFATLSTLPAAVAAPLPAEPPATEQPAELAGESSVSYAGASEWLASLTAEEQEEQIRDWGVVGLAALLEVDVETFRDHAYDRSPVRDPLFADMTNTSWGPGRSFLDGAGTLHLLVPEEDPHAARTIGSLLDERHKDAGTEPERVRIHRYRPDRAGERVTLRSGPAQPTPEVRREHGYRSMAVGTLPELKRFLAATQHLSRLEVRDGALWASGWSWPGTPGGKITAQDLSVLQRGYRDAERGLSREPGFSLDPAHQVRENWRFLAMFPPESRGRAEEILERIDELYSAYTEDRLSWEALVEAREALRVENADLVEAAVNTWTRPEYAKATFQAARYEGGLKGTDAGMTYFYTDLVAKAWPMERGSGSPQGVVPGFVSDLRAKTPWGHCSTGAVSGRLWFGLREEGVSVRDDRVDLGPVATRLFSRVEDPEHRDQEVEPDYDFGRIMHWWDRHYVPMADHEPQYHRLDQLMRWGVAIGWLVERDNFLLPEIPARYIKSDWRFPAWLEANRELKWRYDIPWVEPLGVETEAMLKFYSSWYEDCGTRFYWSGGITSPEMRRLHEIRAARPELRPGISRGGLDSARTRFSSATRSGTIGNSRVQRTLGAIEGRTTRVGVAAQGRKVWSLGRLKAWMAEAADRTMAVAFDAGGGRVSQRVSVQGIELGELTAAKSGQTATVSWRPGILDRARTVVHSIQAALPGRSIREAVSVSRGASMAYLDPAAERALVRVDGARGSRWMALEERLPEAGERMAFRLGRPGQGDEPVSWASARFTDGPPALGGGETGWFEMRPGSGGGPGFVGGSGPPGTGSTRFVVADPGGRRRGELFFVDDRVRARVDDPLFGLEGAPEGATLVNSRPTAALLPPRRAAEATRDGYSRAVRLGEERVGLVGSESLTVVEPGHAWHRRLAAALEEGSGSEPPLYKLSRGDAPPLLVDRPRVLSFGKGEPMELSEVLAELGDGTLAAKPRGPPTLFRSQVLQVLQEGQLPADTLGRGWQVRLVEIESKWPGADITFLDKAEWVRPPGGGGSGAGAEGPDPFGSAASTATRQSVRILYLLGDCDEDDSLLRCGDGPRRAGP